MILIDTVVFLVAAVLAVLGGTMMIAQRNPVLSVMYLILSLVAQAILYAQLGGLFLGAVLIIVYSGAILVLFLFVIMLLNLRGTEDLGQGSKPVSRFAKFLLSLMFVVELILVVKTGFFRSEVEVGFMHQATSEFGSVESVATLLFTKYLYPFELAGLLLLAAIVGAVIMTRNPSPREAALEDGAVEETKNIENEATENL